MTRLTNIGLWLFFPLFYFIYINSACAGILCPRCSGATEEQGDFLVCLKCDYKAEILRVPPRFTPYQKQSETRSSGEESSLSDDMESGACGIGGSIESENAQMLEDYGGFLDEVQQMELLDLMSANLSIRPKIEQWFFSNVGFSSQEPAVCFAPPEQIQEACEASSMQPSAAALLIEKGGTVTAVEQMKDIDVDFFETLSNLPTAMMGRQFDNEEFHKDIGELLQEYRFYPFIFDLAVCFASEREKAHFIFAFIQNGAVFFHGMVAEGRNFKYLIPGFQSGAILVTADIVEMLIISQGEYGFKLYIYEDKPQKTKKKAHKKLAAELPL